MRIFLFFIFLWLPLTVTAAPPVEFPHGQVTVRTAVADHVFEVELALTPAQHERGLMFRKYLAPGAGMLFVFPAPKAVTFWMRNTLIPLDMLFLNRQGAVVAITENAVPESDTLIAPEPDNVLAVLEVPGGTVQRLGLRVGDAVQSNVRP